MLMEIKNHASLYYCIKGLDLLVKINRDTYLITEKALEENFCFQFTFFWEIVEIIEKNGLLIWDLSFQKNLKFVYFLISSPNNLKKKVELRLKCKRCVVHKVQWTKLNTRTVHPISNFEDL